MYPRQPMLDPKLHSIFPSYLMLCPRLQLRFWLMQSSFWKITKTKRHKLFCVARLPGWSFEIRISFKSKTEQVLHIHRHIFPSLLNNLLQEMYHVFISFSLISNSCNIEFNVQFVIYLIPTLLTHHPRSHCTISRMIPVPIT